MRVDFWDRRWSIRRALQRHRFCWHALKQIITLLQLNWTEPYTLADELHILHFLGWDFFFFFLSCYWNVIKCGLESTYKNDEGFHWKMVSTDSLPCLCQPPSMFPLTPLCFLLTYLLPLTPSLFFTDLPLCFQWPLSVSTDPLSVSTDPPPVSTDLPLCFCWPYLRFHWPPFLFSLPPPPPPPPHSSISAVIPLCYHWPPCLFPLTSLSVSADPPLCFHWPPSLFPLSSLSVSMASICSLHLDNLWMPSNKL